MNRWSPGLASPVGQDGDPQPGTGPGPAFRGVDMMSERDLLPPGMVPFSVNKRFRTGSAMKRPGSIEPPDFNPSFGTKPIIGSGIYSDPNGNEQMLVAVKDASYDFGGAIGVRAFVWSLQTGKDARRIPLAATQSFNGFSKVRFCQAFDKVALFREPLNTATAGHMLVWDGYDAVPGHTGSFDDVHGLFNAAEGGTEVPVTTAGETFQNRLLLYTPQVRSIPRRDQVIMTDPSHIEQYDEVFGNFRINSGQADSVVRVFSYLKSSVIVAKARSLHMLENFSGGGGEGTQRQLTGEIGLAGIDAMVRDGADVLFMSEPGGVYRLSEVIQDQIAVPPTPVSMPIDPAIRAINWNAGRGIVASTEDEYAFFAAPMGTSMGNNMLLVYNRNTRLWESGDVWGDPTFNIAALHTTLYNGRRTLFGLDYSNRRVYALYQSVPDTINGQLWHIHDIIETRGYNMGDATRFKRYQRLAIAISTVDPEIKITAISDGWNETKDLTPTGPITKDPLKFYTHGHPDYDGTTDPDEPRREDYSAANFPSAENFAAEDFEGLPEGPIAQLPPTANSVEAPAQQSLVRIPVRTNGRWVSLRIENMSGRCDLLAVAVEGISGNMETRTAA